MRLPAKCCRFLSPQPILLLQIGKERNIYLFVNVSAKKNRKKIGSVVPLMIRFNVGLFFIYELNTLYFYFTAQGGGGGGVTSGGGIVKSYCVISYTISCTHDLN